MHFPSKILMFGEYGLLQGSKGLIFPYENFLGTLQFFQIGKTTGFQAESNRVINKLTEYIAGLNECYFNFEQITYDLSEGLYFESNIPRNVGLGSSAALCAALYDKYCLDKKEDLIDLKNDLSKIESFFHQKSSGIDPLASFLNKPLLINSKRIEILKNFRIKHSNLSIFIIKSKEESKTELLVSSFQEKMKDATFSNLMHQEYDKLIEKNIKHFLGRNTILFRRYLKKLTAFQLKHFSFAFKQEFKNITEEGIKSGLFQLKLLGSGGGYYLGFTSNIADTKLFFENKKINILEIDLH